LRGVRVDDAHAALAQGIEQLEDYLFDLSGTQDRQSRAFVELVAKMIGVTVVPVR
jgi:hypothetical protein